MRASELYEVLSQNINVSAQNWWPNYGTFWIVIESILGQNTKYENAYKARVNLINAGVKSLADVANMEVSRLAELIKPSGFYNTKAKRLKDLCVGICADFGDFESFKEQVSKEWLHARKGLGPESVYSILCYACELPFVVFDKYTATLLALFGYEFESYEEGQEWCQGVLEFQSKLGESLLCAHFHALIVEFAKAHLKGGKLSEQGKKILEPLF